MTYGYKMQPAEHAFGVLIQDQALAEQVCSAFNQLTHLLVCVRMTCAADGQQAAGQRGVPRATHVMWSDILLYCSHTAAHAARQQKPACMQLMGNKLQLLGNEECTQIWRSSN
jgi:hypothetical protein